MVTRNKSAAKKTKFEMIGSVSLGDILTGTPWIREADKKWFDDTWKRRKAWELKCEKRRVADLLKKTREYRKCTLVLNENEVEGSVIYPDGTKRRWGGFPNGNEAGVYLRIFGETPVEIVFGKVIRGKWIVKQ